MARSRQSATYLIATHSLVIQMRTHVLILKTLQRHTGALMLLTGPMEVMYLLSGP